MTRERVTFFLLPVWVFENVTISRSTNLIDFHIEYIGDALPHRMRAKISTPNIRCGNEKTRTVKMRVIGFYIESKGYAAICIARNSIGVAGKNPHVGSLSESSFRFPNDRAPQVIRDQLADGLVTPGLTQTVIRALVPTALRLHVAVEHALDDAEDPFDFHPEPKHLVKAFTPVVV